MRLALGIVLVALALFTAQAQAQPADSPSYNAKVIRHVFGSHGS